MKTLKLNLLSVVFYLLSGVSYANPYAEEMRYVCTVSLFYITYTVEECMAEQENFLHKSRGLTPPELWDNTVWYGHRYNWRGDVVGIDFYKVYERAKYVGRGD